VSFAADSQPPSPDSYGQRQINMEADHSMRIALLCLTMAAALAIAFTIYRFRSINLNVDPHAREVIEKAKRR
jgi:hypothetical protein